MGCQAVCIIGSLEITCFRVKYTLDNINTFSEYVLSIENYTVKKKNIVIDIKIICAAM
jgi:hypothetical protein